MPKLTVGGEYLSQELIDECIIKCRDLTQEDQILEIIATDVVWEVNISVFGSFVLLYQKYNDANPGFKIHLNFKKNVKPYRVDNSSFNNDMISRLRSRYQRETGLALDNTFGHRLRIYVAYAYQATQQADFIKLSYGYLLDEQHDNFFSDNLIGPGNKIRRWLDVSRVFTPILLISKETYPIIFENPLIEYGQLDEKLDFDDNSGALIRNVKAVLRPLLGEAHDANDNLNLLAGLAFYQSLEKLQVLSLYLNKGKRDISKFELSNLSPRGIRDISEKISNLIEDLRQRPAIYQFIFSTLTASMMVPDDIEDKTLESFILTVTDLWKFTKELVFGIQELAKNIINHTRSGKGVLTARIYSEGKFEHLNTNIADLYTNYRSTLEELDNKKTSFFEVYVSDVGSEGISNTLLAKIHELSLNEMGDRSSLQADIDMITEEKVDLASFLDPSRGLRLNQQAKRATAHLGLLALSKLVTGNEGFLRASTWKKNENNKERDHLSLYRGYSNTLENMPPIGTNFHFVLPVGIKLNYRPYFHRDTKTIPKTTPSYIEGIEKLLSFDNIEQRDTGRSSSQRSLVYAKIDFASMLDVKDEYWGFFSMPVALNEKTTDPARFTICVDLEKRKIDASKLFRFLGNWEMCWPGIPLIIFNLSAEDYFELVKLTFDYSRSTDLPFWNKNSAVVVYSYTPLKSKKFYFTDLLWGEDIESFHYINRFLRKTVFNALVTELSTNSDGVMQEVFKHTLLDDSLFDHSQLEGIEKLGIFHTDRILLPFDLLLKVDEEETIFENNAKLLLENEIRTNDHLIHSESDAEHTTSEANDINDENRPTDNSDLSNFIQDIPGYKIVGSHFRIGSKIHISDFYYVKRFFQNSFFASPIAFLVVRTLLNDKLAYLKGRSPKDIELRRKTLSEGLSLVGYGHYSELLMSLIEQFLLKAIYNFTWSKIPLQGSGFQNDAERFNNFISNAKINHDILSDDEDTKLIKHEDLYENIAVIIPTASTFSTSIKVEEAIKRRYPNSRIQEPYINVIYVYNADTNVERRDKLVEQFKIKQQDLKQKTITIESFFSANGIDSKHNVKQRFLLSLPTVWQPVETCDACFPDDPKTEKPLFITDKTFVTPVLIFDHPQGKQNDATHQNPFVLNSAFVRYGHSIHEKKHYLFYIKVEEFFNQNRRYVTDWLKEVREKESFKEISKDQESVILMAPANLSNTGFVNLVNEVLFYNSANVIHYDPQNDHVQNFQLFYKNEIRGEANKVVFVDDVLNTGSTFIKANDFLKYSQTKPQGFDAAIFMIDRSNMFVHENVTRKLLNGSKHCFTYANIQLPSLTESEADCQLCREQERYHLMMENSFLDRLRNYFLAQCSKLHPVEFPKFHRGVFGAKNNIAEAHTDIHIQRMELLHLVYRWFNSDQGENIIGKFEYFEEWMDNVFKQADPKFNFRLNTDQQQHNGLALLEKYKHKELSDTLLKIVSQAPFTFFKPIKERVFKWVIELVIAQSELVIRKITNITDSITEDDFLTLKFLLRRTGLLNSNYLITNQCFELIEHLCRDNGLPKLARKLLEEITQLEAEESFLLVQEKDMFSEKLLIENRVMLARKRHIRNNVLSFNVFFTAQIKELLFMNEARSINLESKLHNLQSQSDGLFNQLIRMLREENGILISKFWNFIKDKIEFEIDYQTNSITLALFVNNIIEHYRYKTLKAFLAQDNNPKEPSSDPAFLKYIWLKNFFNAEILQKNSEILSYALKDKTEQITNKLMEIVFEPGSEQGVFMIIKYKKKGMPQHFIAYNQGSKGKMDESRWKNEKYHYLEKFLEGKVLNNGVSTITVTEFHLKDNNWEDVYAIGNELIQKEIDPDLIPGYDHLLLLRINKRQLTRSDGDKMLPENQDLPQAIIGFYGNLVSARSLPTQKVRYILLLKESISKFISEHHESSEFNDWIEANDMKRTTLLTGHGREMLINIANSSTIDYSTKDTYKDIIATMLIVQRFIIDEQEESKFGLQRSVIRKVFKGYYEPGNQKLDKGYFEFHVGKMIKDVYLFMEIENSVIVLPTIKCDDTLKFSFPALLLNMMIFEILVNAKKNRWVFSDNEAINGHTVNYVRLEIKQNGKDLLISVINSGPFVESHLLTKLKSGINIKDNDEASGIYLIQKLLSVFDLGMVDFACRPIYGKFSEFEVTLKLGQWPQKKRKY